MLQHHKDALPEREDARASEVRLFHQSPCIPRPPRSPPHPRTGSAPAAATQTERNKGLQLQEKESPPLSRRVGEGGEGLRVRRHNHDRLIRGKFGVSQQQEEGDQLKAAGKRHKDIKKKKFERTQQEKSARRK